MIAHIALRVVLAVILGAAVLSVLVTLGGCATPTPVYVCVPAQSDHGPVLVCGPHKKEIP